MWKKFLYMYKIFLYIIYIFILCIWTRCLKAKINKMWFKYLYCSFRNSLCETTYRHSGGTSVLMISQQLSYSLLWHCLDFTTEIIEVAEYKNLWIRIVNEICCIKKIAFLSVVLKIMQYLYAIDLFYSNIRTENYPNFFDVWIVSSNN